MKHIIVRSSTDGAWYSLNVPPIPDYADMLNRPANEVFANRREADAAAKLRNSTAVKSKTEDTKSTWDTDSGLGIGGVNNDQSMPFIPSERAIARVQRMADTDTICRRCGASRNFSGAMFTTVGGNICDDCA